MFYRTEMFALVMGALAATSYAAAAEDVWRVSKSTGDAWIASAGAQPVSLSSDTILKPGDMVRTGTNGRVLLVRGTESILVSANSMMTIAPEKREGFTSVLQQAGSILLEVEKKNVQHFEVATPYLAAVVKGTQFRVTVNQRDSQVDVLRGQVQVADYGSGQFAIVNAAQTAKVSLAGPAGLTLSGSGQLSPVQQGTARPSPVPAIETPEGGSSGRRAQNEDPARVASASEQVEQPAPKQPSPGAKFGILDTISGLFSSDGKKNSGDDLKINLGLPLAAGFLVTVGAAVVRRRRRNDPNGK